MKLKWTLPVLLVTLTAAAQMPSAPMPSVMDQFMQVMGTSMTKMDKGMAAASMTGDVDHDFATMMMPHHEGAIDMAKAELSYGKDRDAPARRRDHRRPAIRNRCDEPLAQQETLTLTLTLYIRKRDKRCASY